MSRTVYAPKQEYIGNGSLADYTFNFKIEALSQLVVITLDETGAEVQRVRGTDTVFLSGVVFNSVDGGGTVTLQANLTNLYTIILLLANDEPTQNFQFSNKLSFNLKRIEAALDFLAGAVMRLAYKGKQSLRLHDSDNEEVINGQLPSTISGEAGKAVVVNANEDGFDFSPVPVETPPVDSVNGKVGVVVLDTSDLSEASNKNYVTDAEQTSISTIGDKVASVVAGTNITVDNTDPQNPVVSASSDLAPVDSVNGQTGAVALDTGDIAEATDKNYVTDAEKTSIGTIGDKLDSVVAGTNITVDDTDPNNPIISSTASGGSGGIAEWVSGATYSQVTKDIVWVAADDEIYRCITTNSDVVFTPAKWTELSEATFDTVKYDPANMIGDVVHMNTLQKVYSHMYSSGVGLDCNITDNGDGSVDLLAGTVTIRPTATGHNNIFHALIPESLGVVLTDDATNYVYVDYNSGTPIWAVTLTESVTNGQDKVLAFIVARQAITLKIINVRDTGVDFANKANTLFKGFSRFMHKQGGSKVGSTGLNLTCTSGIFYFGVNPIPHDSFDTSVAGTANLNTFKYIYTGWNYVSDVKLIDNVNYDNAGTLTPVPLLYWKVDWVYMINGDTSSLAVVYGTEIYTNKSKARKGTPPSSIPSQLSGVGVLIGRVILKRDSTSVITESTFDTVFVASEVTEHNDLSGLQGGAVADYQHLTSAQHTIATQPASATLDGYVSTASQEFAGDKTIIDGNGTNVIRKENNIRYMEDFLKDAPADVTTTTGLTSSVLLSIDRAFDGKYRDLSYTIGLTDTNGTIDFDSIPISGHIDNELLGLHVNYGYNGDAKDWSYIVQESSDNITFTDASSESLSKGEASKAFLNKILFTLKTTSTHYRLRAKCLVENLSKVLRIQNYFVITDPMPTAQFVEVNSISLSGNDGREITAALEDIQFNGSGIGWSSVGNVHTYTIQNEDSYIQVSTGVAASTTNFFRITIYKDGVLHKNIGLNESNVTNKAVGSYTSKVGEFSPGDKISIRSTVTKVLLGDSTDHYLNIVESRSSSNVVFEGDVSADVVVSAYSNSNDVIAGSTAIPFTTIPRDTTSSWSGTQFTAPETGDYLFNVVMQMVAKADYWGIWVQGATDGWIGRTDSDDIVSGSKTLYLERGQTASVRLNASTTLVTGANHRINITKLAQQKPIYSVTPASVEPTVTKVLSTNVSAVETMTDLSFDTVIGEEYEIIMDFGVSRISTAASYIDVYDGATLLRSYSFDNDSSSEGFGNITPTVKYTAKATTLTFDKLGSTGGTVVGNGTVSGSLVQLTHRNRKGVPLVEVARTAHISGGTEYPTADTFDGKVIYARSWVLLSDISSDTTIDTIPSGLKLLDCMIIGDDYLIKGHSYTAGGSSTTHSDAIYVRTTGVVTYNMTGLTVSADTTITIRYTKP